MKDIEPKHKFNIGDHLDWLDEDDTTWHSGYVIDILWMPDESWNSYDGWGYEMGDKNGYEYNITVYEEYLEPHSKKHNISDTYDLPETKIDNEIEYLIDKLSNELPDDVSKECFAKRVCEELKKYVLNNYNL